MKYEILRFLKRIILNPIILILNLRLIDKRKLKALENNYNALKLMTDIRNMKPATGILREIQFKNLEFAKEIIKDLEEQGIRIFIFAGSLLGAERHKGFIPWDDDIDFGCLREDYNRVIEYAKTKYKVLYQKANKYNWRKTSFKSRNTYFKQYPNEVLLIQFPFLKFTKGTSVRNSVSFDIFPLDYYSDNYSYKEHLKYCEKIKRKIWKINNIEKEVEYIKSEIQNNPNIVVKSNTISYGLDNPGSYIESQRTDWWTQEDFFPLKRKKFENTEFWAPNNHIKVLDYWCKKWREFPDNLIPIHEQERK